MEAQETGTQAAATQAQGEPGPGRTQAMAAGKALREVVSRSSQSQWQVGGLDRDPVAILEASSRGRVEELVPIRYGRMLPSPFTFYRGAAALMAHDLATLPATGLQVQACGDCHLMNFGLFATPERNLVFDLTDFDETLPAPWEWDVKRLAASVAVASRDCGLSDKAARAAAMSSVRSYREHLRDYSRMSPLDVWYAQIDMARVIAMAPKGELRQMRQQFMQNARKSVVSRLMPKLVTGTHGSHRFIDRPPTIFHADGSLELVREGLKDYRLSLPPERRLLMDRYRLEDVAVKVVGVGSVGTRCLMGLFFSADDQPLILQIKEAVPSVLEPYAGESPFAQHGQRVVVGQRLMQCSSDIFLGWARGAGGRDFYVRQLRDMKMSASTEGATPLLIRNYAEFCGWALARAHAKTGDAAAISGYLGKSDAFDQALGDFALAYADQTAKDHAALVQAVKTGRLKAIIET